MLPLLDDPKIRKFQLKNVIKQSGIFLSAFVIFSRDFTSFVSTAE